MSAFRAGLAALCLMMLAGCGRAADGHSADARQRTEFVGPHRLAVDVYEADGDVRGVGRRAVLMVHGGGWAAGDRGELRDLAAMAAADGVVAFSMDYRLTSQAGVRWPMPAEDVATVLAWLRADAKRLRIDPTRIGLLGGSAGGHLAAWIARDPDPAKRPAGLIVLWGPWDLGPLPEHGPDWVRPTVARLLDGQPARDASPLHHLVPDMPPTLIVHGADDDIVPVEQSRRACDALRTLGNACTLVELPGQGHAPEDPAQVQRALAAVRAALAAL
ncbi:MAG: alpha/beta hydrolase fold domain-containing protein [Pseudomonadota bacterium]